MTPSTFLHFIVLWIRLYVLSPLLQKWHTRKVGELSSVGQAVPGAVAMVTGPTSGLGKTTAIELGRRGAKVILACRDLTRGAAVAKEVEAAQVKAGFAAQTDVVALDQSSIESTEQCARTVLENQKSLHLLVNNGGIYDMGGARKLTDSGYEQHMMINHLAHFSLTMRLLPLLRKSAPELSGGARIVNVTSALHALARIRARDMFLMDEYSSQLAYANSKCAQIMLTRQLRKLEKASNVHVFAVHPGEAVTTITRGLPTIVQKSYNLIGPLFLLTPEQGARGILHCATSPFAVQEGKKSGGYFGVDCKPHEPSVVACQEKMSTHLWKFSAHAVKLPTELDLLEAQ